MRAAGRPSSPSKCVRCGACWRMTPSQNLRSRAGGVRRTSVIVAPRGDHAGEFGVVSQVVVQAADEVQSGRRALQEQSAQFGAQAATVRSVPDDGNRGLRGVAQRIGHRRHHRDTGRSSAHDQTGVAPGQRLINHHTHREPVAATHQSVGDLALQSGQAPVGEDDGRRGRRRARVAGRGGPGECGGGHRSSSVGVGVTRTKLPADGSHGHHVSTHDVYDTVSFDCRTRW